MMTANMRRTARNKVIVGRKPVFNGDLEVTGYGLAVFPAPPSLPASEPSEETTLTQDLAASHMSASGAVLSDLFGSKAAFVRPDRALLADPATLAALLPPESTVLEVAAADGHDPEMVELCRVLVEQGFRLAVTEEPGGEEAGSALRKIASFAELDVTGLAADRLEHHARRAADTGLVSIATGVDDLHSWESARLAGFELSQGYLLSRPVVVMTEALTPSRLTVLKMIEAVNDPGTSAADLQNVVEADAGLSYRLLHISGLGADGGLRRPVHSIREATVLLGRDWIYRWLILMLVADANKGAPEQLTIAMTRARMAEVVAAHTGLADKDSAFTVGLLSALDLVLGAPRTDIVAKLAITDDLVEALLDGTGRLGAVLDDVLRWEVGDAGRAGRSGLDGRALERAYLEALAYAHSLAETLEKLDKAA